LARGAGLSQLALNHHLRRDAGVIRAGLPEHIATNHAMIADKNILQRKGERVSDMKAAGDIRRRHHDRIGMLIALEMGGKQPSLFPGCVKRFFDFRGIVGFIEHHMVTDIGRPVYLPDRLSATGAAKKARR
jgi:hypothetical protein